MIVDYETCYRELVTRSPRAASELKKWRARRGYAHVVEFVEGFSHKFLFTLGKDDVRNVVLNSKHALDDVETDEQMPEVENFTTPFAFQHLFHWYLEDRRSIPTWKNFRDWMVIGPAAPHWHQLLKAHLETKFPNGERRAWSRAARWRLGNVYLSNIRELDLLVRLRAAGLDIKYHLLADVLFRLDFWIQDTMVCTYFPNKKYRDGRTGRKPPAEAFFRDAKPPFNIRDIAIERQGFGKIWLATDKSVVSLIEALTKDSK